MINVFKILWPKYMLYIFCILRTKYKIQYKQSCTTTPRPLRCKVTMSHEVQSTLLHRTLFGSGYCSVRQKNSVKDIHPTTPGRKITGYYSVTRTNKASDINPPLMNALNLLFEEYSEKLF